MQMNRLRLDYQRSMNPFPLTGAILLIVAIAILILTGSYYYRLAIASADWEDSLKKFERASGGQVTGSYQEVRGVFRDIKQANEVLRQLTLPWEKLFHAVESSTDREVTLLGMEPDIEKHVVNISCEAKDIVAMLNFIKRLEMQQEFSSVYLESHQIQEHDPDKPVRFSLIAFWRAAA
jgi:hypothetical protein